MPWLEVSRSGDVMHEAASFDCAEADDRASRGGRDRLQIFHVMPRGMYFGTSQATSIDLCARDLIGASRFANSTRVFAEAVADAFEGVALHPFPRAAISATRSRANYVAEIAAAHKPDIIIVQQHLPTASAIARRCPDAKVVLQTHNFQRADYETGSVKDWLRRGYKRARYKRLAGLIHVSEACRSAFAANWPDIDLPQAAVHNGFDFADWAPADARKPEVLFVGRCVAEKGVLEAAEAAARALAGRPQWSARFILSAVDGNSGTLQAVRSALLPLSGRARIELQRPFAEVKAAFETASIALVPSIMSEPFGRTALEAHAGGAALISSGSGGLCEVSGPAARYVPEVTPDALAAAIEALIENPEVRARMVREGAAWVRERFSIGSQAARLDDFCLSVLAMRSEIPA
jgi:glycosyltransferase involved in cell wall biosynthesis